MQTNLLFNDNNIKIGVLKTDGTYFTFKNESSYENRVWTAFFYNYGIVYFPITFSSNPGSGNFLHQVVFLKFQYYIVLVIIYIIKLEQSNLLLMKIILRIEIL